jgi:murein L,D-transpeptidase YcbB/YkuD
VPELQQLVNSGTLPGLRWPNFTSIQPDVASFYELNSYGLAWVSDGAPTQQAMALMSALQNAALKGLDPNDYDAWRWNVADGGPERFDLALTISAVRYVHDVSCGKVDPSVFSFGLHFDQKKCNLSEAAHALMKSRDVGAELALAEPPFEGYWRTEKALAAYIALAREDTDATPGPARAECLLRLVGDLGPNDALADGVKRFQTRHGIEPDGRIGKDTLRQLNTPLSQRVAQLRLVLERWRWVPHSFSRPPIVVNIPEFRLRAYDDHYRPELEMKVVVGKAYRHKTPVFSDNMRYVIFRPYWDVPLSIVRAELAPKIAKDPGYLAGNEYEVVDSRRQVVTRDAVSARMLEQLRAGRLFIRQIPGDKNALGPIKFLFPNQYDVYLHGTPAKALFLRSRRDFSHGCIRVEKPEELAQWVLRGVPGWDMEHIQNAEHGVDAKRVDLDSAIPVLIVYGTAVVEGDEVYFFDDIYGHDAALAELLDHGYPYSGWQPTSAARGRRPHE